MEPHIRGVVYIILQPVLAAVTVECFLWEKGAEPLRIFTAKLGASEFSLSLTPTGRTTMLRGLHRACLERIASADDPDRIHAEEAFSLPALLLCLSSR
jgi:hypothetical protein